MRIDRFKRVFFFALLLPLFTAKLSAQVTEDTEYDFRGRISAEVDKKIVSGLHVSVSEEFRMKENFTTVDRFYTNVGLSYKVCPYFKVAAGYTLMNINNTEDGVWKMRHRANLDLIGMYKAGNVKLALRERLQYTYKSGTMNVWQSPRNELALRSRLKISYDVQTKPVEPYLAVELRNTLNAVSYTSYSHDSEAGDNVAYNDAYISRVRLQPGVEWKLRRRSSLDFFLLGDYVYSKSYDANKKGDLKPLRNDIGMIQYTDDGSVLYAIYYRKYWNFSIGIGYKFAF